MTGARGLTGLALTACVVAVVASPHLGCDGSSSAPLDANDAATQAVCLEAGLPDLSDAAIADAIALPAACATPPQRCNPTDASGCAAGETCDLAADGTFACVAPGTVPDGGACDGASGPYCALGSTCVMGRCARLCCADADCTGGTCVSLAAMHATGGHVGTCAGGDADAGAIDGGMIDAGSTDAGVTGSLTVGNHDARVEGRGFLVPWTSWGDALAREFQWFDKTCPQVSGYPMFATTVHLDDQCLPTVNDAIPAMQNSTGIMSYLKYYIHTGRKDPSLLAVAKSLADYMLDQALTPDGAAYAKFPRSTGQAKAVPQPPDCGSQADKPYEVEPDKGGILGHALMLLATESGDAKYSAAALAIAQALAKNQAPGDLTHTPWPFRVDYRTGDARNPVSANLSYILRLYDDLISAGHGELSAPRDALWSFIKNVQIPNLRCNFGYLWVQFFEDWDNDYDRNAWAPLSLARYLLEKRDALDPDWKADVETVLDFVDSVFMDQVSGFRMCIEQDFDRKAFGGIVSTYAATTALYAKATGNAAAKMRAYQALTILVYSVSDDGCPKDRALETGCGGWVEDAHLDRAHNFVDVLDAFPEWEN